jgi:flavin reductase (DIM6/NTAB) family NADH-FMN oxidoreductase RutF
MEFHHPSQTVLITGRHDEQDNLEVCNWHMPASANPRIYAVSLPKDSPTKELIEKSKVFVVNFMPYRYFDEVRKCSLVGSKFEDKFKENNFRKADCSSIDCCYVKEACAFIECEVISAIDSGDHIIFLGEVIKSISLSNDKRLIQKSDGSFTTTIH